MIPVPLACGCGWRRVTPICARASRRPSLAFPNDLDHPSLPQSFDQPSGYVLAIAFARLPLPLGPPGDVAELVSRRSSLSSARVAAV
jgi:hypothetical protein